MARHFFAITLFATLIVIAAEARASDFTDHFTLTKPPVAVPPFTFQDAKGRELGLSDFRGRYVLLNLWATWCGPCTREMPALDNLAGKLAAEAAAPSAAKPVTISTAPQAAPPRMEVVALTEDHDGLSVAANFYKRHNISHLPIFIDSAGEAPSILHINGLPTTLLIDPRGMEIGRVEGQTDWDDPATVAFLEAQIRK